MKLRKLVKRARKATRRAFELADPRTRLSRRVAAAKRAQAASPYVYSDDPRLSLILLSYNHRANIAPILTRLRATAADELIVCEDGSIDGSERDWLRRLTRPNEFMIRSNDLHEIRAYNRAVGYARGEFVCVLQDDDIPPADGQWVDDALALFERHPKLAVLGCFQAFALELRSPTGTVELRSRFGAWPTKTGLPVDEIPFADPVLGIPFMFAEGLGIGPIFFRRATFLALGGFDPGFSEAGESGILLDYEMCLKAWVTGWQVGLYEAPAFRRYVGGQGTMMFGKPARKRNLLSNLARLGRAYGDAIDDIDATIGALNRGLVRRTGAGAPVAAALDADAAP
jgi:GT2 family glycosyltransferase